MRYLALIAVLAACDGGEGTPDARPPDGPLPTGTFSLTWTLTDGTSGAPVTCDDVEASFVRVTAVPAVGAGIVESFTCANGMGTSRPLQIGTYSLSFTLSGVGGDIANAPGVNGVVVTANQDTPAGAPDFEVDASGAVSFRLSTSQATNCDPIGMMGSGIDAIGLTLTKGGTCVPVTWMVGAEPYAAACPTPATRACFENTVDVAATGLGSGRYMLMATGAVMGTDCWTGAREIRVPTGGMSATTTLTLAYDAANPACPMLP
jgi:hypothetical protein